MGNKTKSYRGWGGQTNHYDEQGRKVGESRPNFWGGENHYDANGKKIGESRQNFWGGTNHYDSHGNKVGESRHNFWGGTNHYDSHGKKVAESHQNFLGGTTTEHGDDAHGPYRPVHHAAGGGCLVWIVGVMLLITCVVLLLV